MIIILRILAVLVFIFHATQAQSAVAVQGCTPTIGSTTGSYFTTNTTFNLSNVTVSAGSNLALTVIVGFDPPATTPTVTSVTWDAAGANQALTQVNPGGTAGTGGNSEMWALTNPTPGTNKQVHVVVSPSSALFITACAWTGVDQTGGTTSFPNGAHAAGAATINITSATGHIVVASELSGLGITGVTGTLIFFDNTNSTFFNAGSNYDNGAATVTIGTSNVNANIIGTDIKAASGGGGCNGGLLLRGVGGC